MIIHHLCARCMYLYSMHATCTVAHTCMQTTCCVRICNGTLTVFAICIACQTTPHFDHIGCHLYSHCNSVTNKHVHWLMQRARAVISATEQWDQTPAAQHQHKLLFMYPKVESNTVVGHETVESIRRLRHYIHL